MRKSHSKANALRDFCLGMTAVESAQQTQQAFGEESWVSVFRRVNLANFDPEIWPLKTAVSEGQNPPSKITQLIGQDPGTTAEELAEEFDDPTSRVYDHLEAIGKIRIWKIRPSWFGWCEQKHCVNIWCSADNIMRIFWIVLLLATRSEFSVTVGDALLWGWIRMEL